MDKLFQRINFDGKLDDISLVVCRDFELGNFVSNRLINIGYEDFNYILETAQNKYFVKIFSNFRTDENCKRYMDVISKVGESGIASPELFHSKQGHLHSIAVDGAKLRLCVMKYIDGENFLSLKQKPSKAEIIFLAQQAALINSIDIKPEFIYDSWAITNFPKEFADKEKYLSLEDLEMLKPLAEEFESMEIQKLPHCFVHGDLIATNVMKDGKSKVWIIDFSVSNYYPRIQELAVLAYNMFFDENDKSKSENNLKIALEEYQKIIKLTPRELEVLPNYIKFAHAMFLLQANYNKVSGENDSAENDYWLKQGRAGLS